MLIFSSLQCCSLRESILVAYQTVSSKRERVLFSREKALFKRNWVFHRVKRFYWTSMKFIEERNSELASLLVSLFRECPCGSLKYTRLENSIESIYGLLEGPLIVQVVYFWRKAFHWTVNSITEKSPEFSGWCVQCLIDTQPVRGTSSM